MLGTIVDYLHNARVPFRLASYPGDEARPIAAHPLPGGALRVDTQLFLLEGRAVLVVFPATEKVDASAVSAALGGAVFPATAEDLPQELQRRQGSVPPLGQLFGLPIVVDERVSRASVVVFRAFEESDYFEIAYDELARLEQPRVASFSSFAELGTGAHA